jgi:endonuclease-3
MLVRKYSGTVPSTMEELLTLPGVGRKTANIVLYHAMGRNEGIAVDTHVKRLAQRIGFSNFNDQDRIEQDLMRLFPQESWGDLTDLLIAHGRTCCTAKKPQCGICPISGFCRYFGNLKRE